jgi:ornithine carbamoyltransferase
MSRYVDAIMIRMLSHLELNELAQYASVPVINGLTKKSHPCQVLADIQTFEERLGSIRGRTVAWTGDANNVLTVRPGVVVGYERNTYTNEKYDKAGITVLPIPGEELGRGRGGARCMSCPMERDGI